MKRYYLPGHESCKGEKLSLRMTKFPDFCESGENIKVLSLEIKLNLTTISEIVSQYEFILTIPGMEGLLKDKVEKKRIEEVKKMVQLLSLMALEVRVKGGNDDV